MTPTEYQQRALRTVNAALSPRDRLWESAVGIAAEAAELLGAETEKKRAKELGDICWYIASLCDVTGYPFTPIWIVGHPMPFSRDVSARDVVVTAGMLADHLKKHLAQGHDLDLGTYLPVLTDAILGEAWRLNKEIGEIWAMNIAKLEARYANGFTAQASRERTDSGTPPK